MNKVVFCNDEVMRNDYPNLVKAEKNEIEVNSLEKFDLNFELTGSFRKHLFKISENNFGTITLLIENSDDALVNLNIHILANSHITLNIFYLNAKNTVLDLNVLMERDSYSLINEFFLSNGKSVHRNVYNLNGSNSVVHNQFVGISSGTSIQKIDILFNHKAPDTFGDTNGVVIAKDSGFLLVNTKSQIDQGMKGSNAFQKVRGVILSDQSALEINPILLIDEFDVKAGHGATIGKIEEELLFYLMSRGITRSDAEKMIVNAFIAPILKEIKSEVFKERASSLIEGKL